jgi:predicted amidophosphoribosyltransferase
MDQSILTSYELQSRDGDTVLILVRGERLYYSVIQRAFPKSRLSRIFDDRFGRYEWGTFVSNVNQETEQSLGTLLESFRHHIYIDDPTLTETFALDFHMRSASLSRTQIGQLVYQSKPYSKSATPENRLKAKELAQKFCAFIDRHPTYASADMVLAIPPRLGKTFDLPREITKEISSNRGIEDGSAFIAKIRQTKPMKDCISVEEKIANVRGAFAVSEEGVLSGRKIILIDDIYQTGFTMNEAGRVMLEAGADLVLGLAATKTMKDI